MPHRNVSETELFERIDSRNKAGLPSPVEDNEPKKKLHFLCTDLRGA